MKLRNLLRDALGRDAVASTVRNYEQDFGGKQSGSLRSGTVNEESIAKDYYNLVTDLYEWGWGQSFHFAPRAPGETFAASLARHEHYIAHRLGLGPGMRVVDVGCGVGGPLCEIARFSGATIVGLNISSYQLDRASILVAEAGVAHLAEFLQSDFMKIDTPDDAFDAAYAIESTVHTADKAGVFGEVFRVLRPGSCFAAYEYCLTDRFDAGDVLHQQIKAELELGGALSDIAHPRQIDSALAQVGFELLEAKDLSVNPGPGPPWYHPLDGSRFSLTGFRRSRVGRRATNGTLRMLEALRVVPKGTLQVAKLLDQCAAAMVDAGKLGIFTPMYFVLARKPG